MRSAFAWISHNRLYELARQGQRLTPWLAVLVLSICFTLLPSLLPLSEWLASYRSISLAAAALVESAELAIAFGGTIILVGLWVFFYERRPFSSLGFQRAAALVQYGRGLLMGLLAFAGVVGLMALLGAITFEPASTASAGASAWLGVLLVLPGWIVQGASEEIATRGWILPTIGARYRPFLGILLSTLFFTVMHAFNPGLSLIAIANLALYSLFAALYALREGSLWGICAFHSAWNWAQGNLFGLSVSGKVLDIGTLIDLMSSGPDWLTGGAFGPEGSLVTTLGFGLATMLLLFWPAGAMRAAMMPNPK